LTLLYLRRYRTRTTKQKRTKKQTVKQSLTLLERRKYRQLPFFPTYTCATIGNSATKRGTLIRRNDNYYCKLKVSKGLYLYRACASSERTR